MYFKETQLVEELEWIKRNWHVFSIDTQKMLDKRHDVLAAKITWHRVNRSVKKVWKQEKQTNHWLTCATKKIVGETFILNDKQTRIRVTSTRRDSLNFYGATYSSIFLFEYNYSHACWFMKYHHATDLQTLYIPARYLLIKYRLIQIFQSRTRSRVSFLPRELIEIIAQYDYVL